MRFGSTSAALAAGLLAIAPATAAPKFLGKAGTWFAYTNNNERGLFCYATSRPSATAASSAKRASTFFMVSDQPVRNVVDEPQIISGYETHDSNTLTVSVGGKAFAFFLQGGNAWLVQLSENDQFIQAMRSSASAVVTGTGPGGVAIRDTYDLTGFPQALAKARTACGMQVAGKPLTVSRLFR